MPRAAEAYLGFHSIKPLGVSIAIPPGWDASPSQVTPSILPGFPNSFLIPVYTLSWREALSELPLMPKNTT